tara:strand:+ start:113 stop:937 length:825 start_codon:yes stop_codon:yes gene_type:complete
MPTAAAIGSSPSLLQGFMPPPYHYSKHIASPDEMGMGQGASLGDITSDIGGLLAYLTVLIEGGGEAQLDTQNCAAGATGSQAKQNCKGLGEQTCGPTVAKLTDIDTGKTVSRSLYYNFRPNPDGMFGTGFMGLIPGIVDVFLQLNIGQVFGAITGPAAPPGLKLTVPDNADNNKDGKCTGYFSCQDILQMRDTTLENASKWSDMSIKDIKSKCEKAVKDGSKGGFELFTNHSQEQSTPNISAKMPDDPFIKLYYAAISFLGLYIIARYFYPKHT